MSFGNRMSAARKILGWNQGALATTMKVNISTISDWERDKTSPNKKNYKKMEEVLLVPAALKAEES